MSNTTSFSMLQQMCQISKQQTILESASTRALHLSNAACNLVENYGEQCEEQPVDEICDQLEKLNQAIELAKQVNDPDQKQQFLSKIADLLSNTQQTMYAVAQMVADQLGVEEDEEMGQDPAQALDQLLQQIEDQQMSQDDDEEGDEFDLSGGFDDQQDDDQMNVELSFGDDMEADDEVDGSLPVDATGAIPNNLRSQAVPTASNSLGGITPVRESTSFVNFLIKSKK